MSHETAGKMVYRLPPVPSAEWDGHPQGYVFLFENTVIPRFPNDYDKILALNFRHHRASCTIAEWYQRIGLVYVVLPGVKKRGQLHLFTVNLWDRRILSEQLVTQVRDIFDPLLSPLPYIVGTRLETSPNRQRVLIIPGEGEPRLL